MIAVIVQALLRLGRAALKSWLLAMAALVAGFLSWMGLHPLLLLGGAGLLSGLIPAFRKGFGRLVLSNLWLLNSAAGPPLSSPSLEAAAPLAPASVGALFLFFLKTGSVLFGSGYVLLAFLRADLVERWHWLTEQQLLDAVAVGQVTPGPLFTSATFIGYVLGGPSAALMATVGIFLPAFVYVALIGPVIPRLRASAMAGAILDGVNAVALALMAVVTLQLGVSAIRDWVTALLAASAGVVLLRSTVNSAWLIAGGAMIGLITWFIQ